MDRSPLPDRVGEYEILHRRFLGHGTYGEVCVGKNINDNTEVAVKRVTFRQHARVNIEEELRTLQSISHPNIIKLLYHERIGQHTFFVLELCDCDLQHFASQRSEFESLKLRFIRDSTLAVQCLHENGIIHRDLKPENILVKELDGTWVIKVSDFGASRRIPEGVGSVSFSASAGIGTLAYMAPEVIGKDGHAKYSKPADIHSLGLVHLSIVEQRPGESLQPKKIGKLSVGEWIREQQRIQGEKAIDMPTLVHEDDSRIVLAIKRLVSQMIRPLASTRCTIQMVSAEIQSLSDRGEFDAGQTQLNQAVGGASVNAPQTPATLVVHSAQACPPSHLPTAHVDTSPRPDFVPDASSEDAQPASGQPPRPLTGMESLEVETSSLHQTQGDRSQDVVTTTAGVTLTQLQRFSMPPKAPKGLINFGLGQQLDALWLESHQPDKLHYSKYQDGAWVEVWSKELPLGHHWSCRKCATSSHVILQSVSNEACFFCPDTLDLDHRARSPGWICGLMENGLAIVGNHANPSVAIEGARFSVSPLDALKKPRVELQVPRQKAYGMGDFMWACGSADGHVALTNGRTCVDLYRPSGIHCKSVDMPGPPRRPSCSRDHVFVPVRTTHPMIQVLTWTGELVRTLGAEDLELRDNEWCWSISPIYDGKMIVLVTDADDQDYVCTYKVEE